MKKALILFLFTTLFFRLAAQNLIQGKVIDSSTKVPLAFVNISINQSGRGVSTDIDGKFKIQNKEGIQNLNFSYVGYKPLTFSIAELKKHNFIVALQKTAYDLKEVHILPGENPAHRIIDAVIANRDQNNPEKATAFFYESYNKLIFTGGLDSAIANLPDSIKEKDSNIVETEKFLEKQHFFISESVTERNHIPPIHSKEVVTASRVSGLKRPFFALIGTQLQSFSLYDTYIQLLSHSYLSPISKGSTSKYLFELKDTLFQGNDTVFSITYRPRKGKNFEGLSGVLNINSDGYAVQNFTAKTLGHQSGTTNLELEVNIHQRYEKVEQKQWFPMQLNTNLIIGLEEFDSAHLVVEGRSYIKNVELQSRLNKREIGNVVLEMGENAGTKDSSYWNHHRIDSLTDRELNTYRLMDSIGEKHNLDKKLFIYQSLLKGSFPIGSVDLLLTHLLDFNRFEGVRLGMGAETNDRLSKHFRIGAYGAYGFRDEKWKYGTFLKWNRKQGKHLSAKIAYSKDVIESGGSFFLNDRIKFTSTEAMYKFFILDMDQVERYDFQLETHALRDFQTAFFVNHQIRSIQSDYRFNPFQLAETGSLSPEFKLTEVGVQLRFAFREKFVEMFGIKRPVSDDYPILHLKYSRGIEGLADGDFDYNRFELKIQKLFRFRNLGETNLRLKAGYIDQAIPLTAMFRMRGIADDELIYAADFNFQTAYPNEFFHDRYLSFFFKHSFKNLLFRSKYFNPELTLVSNIGWGKMNNKNVHENLDFNAMRNGFFESGIQIDRLLGIVEEGLNKIGYQNSGIGNFGFGAYYRYGSHRLASNSDNIFYKVTYTLRI